MANMKWTAFLSLLLISSAGCGGAGGTYVQPERQDPLAGIETSPVPYENLVLGVVASENTKTTFDNTRPGQTNILFSAEEDEQIRQQCLSIFRRNFGKIVKLDRIDDALSRGVDLVAVYDIFWDAGNAATGMTCDMTTVFMTPGRNPIDTVKGRGNGRILTPFSVGRTARKIVAEANRAMETGLRSSDKLAEFARSKQSSASARATPAAKFHSDVDSPTYKFPEDNASFALVIGVEQYASLPAAEHAERDATAMREHLASLGYPARNTVFLTGSKASKASLEKYLEAWLPRNVPEDARLFVYFSGHGAPDTKTGDAYLVPQDGDAKFIETTGYPVRRLYEKLNALKARRIVVALDACFSGAGGRSVLPKGTRPLISKIDTGTGHAGRLAVLTASGADEITGAAADQGHGLFTYHLLRAFNEARGSGTVKGLYDALLPRVRDAARLDNRDQTPQLLLPQDEDAAAFTLR